MQEYEFIAFLVSSLSLLIRVCLEFKSRAKSCHERQGSCVSLLVICVSFNLAHWYMYYRMSEDLRWRRYKIIGTDPHTLRTYKNYELFAVMRKLDVQFSLIMLVRAVFASPLHFGLCTLDALMTSALLHDSQ